MREGGITPLSLGLSGDDISSLESPREEELFQALIVNFLQAMNAPKKVTMCGRGITPLGFLNALLLHIGPANRHKG